VTQAMHQILVIEDEPAIRNVLRVLLEADGYRFIEADTAMRAEIEARSHKPDLLLVDLGLPDGDGLKVIRRVRAWSPVPVIVLSARTMEEQKIAALDAGADDYVTKPFSPREVVLRVQAILRRHGQSAAEESVSYGAGALVIDEARHLVTVRGEVADLTPTEWGILLALANVPGRVYSRFELINRVRGYEFDGYERIIDSHVKNLRRKIERDPGEPEIVRTVLGGGYRLDLDRDD
jgi:DNA-binding response OmpR family regulator